MIFVFHVHGACFSQRALVRSPPRSVIPADFFVQFAWIRMRLSLSRRISSSTRTPCGLFYHSTSIPQCAFLAGFRCRLDLPFFWRVWNYCRHCNYAFFLALVSCLHYAPTHLVHHNHGAYLPPCTICCCRRAYLSTRPRGFPLQGASNVSRITTTYSPSYRLQFGMLRTLTLTL